MNQIPGQSVLEVIQSAGIDWRQDCGGKGKCVTCRFKIVDGFDSLIPETERELHYRKLKLLSYSERLACQAVVNGTIRIRIPKSCRLPHMKYVD